MGILTNRATTHRMFEILATSWKAILTLFVLQGCLGIYLVELSLKQMKRAIEVVEERDS